MTIHDIPAQISAWIECPRCDRPDEPTVEARIASELTSPKLEKLHATCERCGGFAILYLQRAPPQMH
jgi:RNase P subunit RPR2